MVATATERGRATRERLLDAAARLVPEVGWGAVTTRMVADRAGVNPGLVHYHFSSVAGLLAEAALRVARQLVAGPRELLVQAPDTRTAVERLLAALQPYTGTDPASLLLTEAFLASTRDERLRDELGALLSDFRAEVAGWLRAQGHGDADAAAAVLAAAIDGLILHRAIDPSQDLASCTGALQQLLAPHGTGEAVRSHGAVRSHRMEDT
ncbi:MAG: TetR/AcrR family transcriptional regulator [Pseudonocardiaceae bacterium]